MDTTAPMDALLEVARLQQFQEGLVTQGNNTEFHPLKQSLAIFIDAASTHKFLANKHVHELCVDIRRKLGMDPMGQPVPSHFRVRVGMIGNDYFLDAVPFLTAVFAGQVPKSRIPIIVQRCVMSVTAYVLSRFRQAYSVRAKHPLASKYFPLRFCYRVAERQRCVQFSFRYMHVIMSLMYSFWQRTGKRLANLAPQEALLQPQQKFVLTGSQQSAASVYKNEEQCMN